MPLSPEGSQLGMELLEALLASVLMHGWSYPIVPWSQPAVMISCGLRAMKSLGSIALSPSSMLLPPQSIFQALQREGSIPSSMSPLILLESLMVWFVSRGFIALLAASCLVSFP